MGPFLEYLLYTDCSIFALGFATMEPYEVHGRGVIVMTSSAHVNILLDIDYDCDSIHVKENHMKLILVKCAVCSNWLAAWRTHCDVCGSFQMRVNGVLRYFDSRGIEVKRATDMISVDSAITRLVRSVQ